MSADPVQPTLLRRTLRLVAIVIVFGIVGPPVGAVIFMLAVALLGMNWKPDVSSMLLMTAFSLIYAAPLSYFIALPPAMTAGALIGLRLAFFGRMGWLLALAAALAVGGLMEVVLGQTTMWSVGEDVAPPVLGITCAIATFVCWTIVRCWDFPTIVRARAGAVS